MSDLTSVAKRVRDENPGIVDPDALAPLVASAWLDEGLGGEVLVPHARVVVMNQQRNEAAVRLSRGSGTVREVPMPQFESRTVVPHDAVKVVSWVARVRETALLGNGRYLKLDQFTIEDCNAYAERRHEHAASEARRAEQMERVAKALEHAGVATVADLADDVLTEALDGSIPE